METDKERQTALSYAKMFTLTHIKWKQSITTVRWDISYIRLAKTEKLIYCSSGSNTNNTNTNTIPPQEQ